MAKVTITIEDQSDGTLFARFASAPSFPAKAEDRTPAQRIAWGCAEDIEAEGDLIKLTGTRPSGEKITVEPKRKPKAGRAGGAKEGGERG